MLFIGKDPTCQLKRQIKKKKKDSDQEDPLEKEMATHSSILAWKIPVRGAWQAAVHGVARVGYH